MKTHRCRIDNEQEFKGRYGVFSAALGMKSDCATAARVSSHPWARQTRPPWAGRVVVQVLGWGLAFVSLLLVLSHGFMRLGNFLSMWVN